MVILMDTSVFGFICMNLEVRSFGLCSVSQGNVLGDTLYLIRDNIGVVYVLW